MKDPDPVYIDYKMQDNYPSGSTISYFGERFYIMGDDASEILILNESLDKEERIQLFPKGKDLRVPKALKADIEASVVISQEGREFILFLGSGSLSPHRDSAFLFDPGSKELKRIDLAGFYDELRAYFSHLNIEAATMIGEDLILGIRGNTSNPDNFIVLASFNGLSPRFKRKLFINLPVEHAGISGMDYDEQHNVLFITFSSESTSNSIDDGEIGESYLAIITGGREQLKNHQLIIPSLTKLSDLSDELKHKKIESVSLIKGKRQLLLIADDDKGGTSLFKLGF